MRAGGSREQKTHRDPQTTEQQRRANRRFAEMVGEEGDQEEPDQPGETFDPTAIVIGHIILHPADGHTVEGWRDEESHDQADGFRQPFKRPHEKADILLLALVDPVLVHDDSSDWFAGRRRVRHFDPLSAHHAAHGGKVCSSRSRLPQVDATTGKRAFRIVATTRNRSVAIGCTYPFGFGRVHPLSRK